MEQVLIKSWKLMGHFFPPGSTLRLLAKTKNRDQRYLWDPFLISSFSAFGIQWPRGTLPSRTLHLSKCLDPDDLTESLPCSHSTSLLVKAKLRLWDILTVSSPNPVSTGEPACFGETSLPFWHLVLRLGPSVEVFQPSEERALWPHSPHHCFLMAGSQSFEIPGWL